ncbi:MAG: branched-chain amino acid ABC transporter permease [Candidatus Rokubacteria bacterium]|nr:branched-chain amino acid ABC transporter permease [Candidatus Rokubacteria bacterium]
MATREDEDSARAAGVDVRRFKILAFSIGTALAGLAGSLYAHYLTFISAGDFGFPFSITILCMLVLGGIGTNRGAILLALMRWAPHGLVGDESWLWRILRRRAAA